MATNTLPARRAMLRAASMPATSSKLVVDKKAGTISGIAIMSKQPAQGWGFVCDDITLDTIVTLANAAGPAGTRCRLGHPPIQRERGPDGTMQETIADDAGRVIGAITGVYRDGDTVRGTLALGEYAKSLPDAGNVWDYILPLAEQSPLFAGFSCVFGYDVETIFDAAGNVIGNAARPLDLEAIDFVGRPASNPAGMLSARVPMADTAPNVADPFNPGAQTFDPQPGNPSKPDGVNGWQDPSGQTVPSAPTPADSIEYPAAGDPMCNRLYAHVQRAARLGGGKGACRFAGMSADEMARLDYMSANGFTVCRQRYPGGGVYGVGSRAAQSLPARMAARTLHNLDDGDFSVDGVTVIHNDANIRRKAAFDAAAQSVMREALGYGAVQVELPESFAGSIPAARDVADAAGEHGPDEPPVYGDPQYTVTARDSLLDKVFRTRLSVPGGPIALLMAAAPVAARLAMIKAQALSAGIDPESLTFALQQIEPHIVRVGKMSDRLFNDGTAGTDDDDDEGEADYDPQDRDQMGPSSHDGPIAGDPGTAADFTLFKRSQYAKQRSDGSFYREVTRES